MLCLQIHQVHDSSGPTFAPLACILCCMGVFRFIPLLLGDTSPESVVTTKWMLICESVLSNVLQMRIQSLAVCKNNTDTNYVPQCQTTSNIVSCAYASSDITGEGDLPFLDDYLANYTCAESDYHFWLNMLGGTMPA